MLTKPIKNYLLIKNSIVWLDPNLTACAVQFEFDDFFFTYFLGVIGLWKHIQTIILETFKDVVSHTRLLKRYYYWILFV